MKTYDVILTLGNGLNEQWKLPEIVSLRLKKIADLYFQKVSNKIIVCGRWSINWDIKGITPPTTEAEEMKKFLLSLGVADEDVIKEEWSRDTIGNAYFAKIKIIKPNNFKTILVVCSDFHLKRAQFLFQKIFNDESSTFSSRSINSREENNDTNLRGKSRTNWCEDKPRGFEKVLDEYQMDFLTTPTEMSRDPEFMKMEDGVLQRQKKFLLGMRDGDDTFLQTRLYNDPYYAEKRSEKVAQVAMGGVK